MDERLSKRARLARRSAIAFVVSGVSLVLGFSLCGYQNYSGWGGPLAEEGIFVLLVAVVSFVVGAVLAIAALVTPPAAVDPATGQAVAGPAPSVAPLLFYAGGSMTAASALVLAQAAIAFSRPGAMWVYFPFAFSGLVRVVAFVLAIAVLVVAFQRRVPPRVGVLAGAWLLVGAFRGIIEILLRSLSAGLPTATIGAAAVGTALGVGVLVEGLRLKRR